MENEYGAGSKDNVRTLIDKGKKSEQPKKNCGCINKCPHTISNSVGELVIVVTRKTFTLPVTLPYCIWGTLYAQTNFGVVVTPYIPVVVPAITGTSITTPQGNLQFIYTNGDTTDIIEVSVPGIGLISYLEILSGLKTNYFNTCFMTFDCNSKNDAITLDNSDILRIQSEGLFLQKVGGTGNKDAQLIIPKSRRQINNSIMNIIEIYLRNEPIKPETVWVHSIPFINVMGYTNHEYNFTIYISDKVDMNAAKI